MVLEILLQMMHSLAASPTITRGHQGGTLKEEKSDRDRMFSGMRTQSLHRANVITGIMNTGAMAAVSFSSETFKRCSSRS